MKHAVKSSAGKVLHCGLTFKEADALGHTYNSQWTGTTCPGCQDAGRLQGYHFAKVPTPPDLEASFW